jgi:hypothetical protein
VQYSFPDNTAQHRVRVGPNNGAGVKVDKNELGQVPQSVRFQFKVDSAAPQTSWIVLNVSDAAGHIMGLWVELAASDYNRWNERSAKLVWGALNTYPLTIQDISLVGQNATGANVGTFTFAGMKLQYAVGTPTEATPYQPIDPGNPSWLRYTEDPADFRSGGKTFIIGDDGHLVAANPGSTSATNIADMVQRIKGKSFQTPSGQTVAPHPDKHVVLMYGHSRGFADQLIDPQGNPADAKTGIPQFTIADIGMPPYVAANRGGFFHFALFHVNSNGSVQYAVVPMLRSVTIEQGTAGADTLAAGQHKQYTATAVNSSRSDIISTPTMPVADPMSHVWSSSDRRVAAIDPVTGAVTAVKAGTTTISVSTGGITSSVKLTVSPAQQG